MIFERERSIRIDGSSQGGSWGGVFYTRSMSLKISTDAGMLKVLKDDKLGKISCQEGVNKDSQGLFP